MSKTIINSITQYNETEIAEFKLDVVTVQYGFCHIIVIIDALLPIWTTYIFTI